MFLKHYINVLILWFISLQGETDELTIDPEHLKHFMIVPNLTPNSSEGQTVIPIQALSSLPTDTPQTVVIPTVSMPSQGAVTSTSPNSPNSNVVTYQVTSSPSQSASTAQANSQKTPESEVYDIEKEQETAVSFIQDSTSEDGESSKGHDVKVIQLEYNNEEQSKSAASPEKTEVSVADTGRQNNLHAVLSHLISTQASTELREENPKQITESKKKSPQVSPSVAKSDLPPPYSVAVGPLYATIPMYCPSTMKSSPTGSPPVTSTKQTKGKSKSVKAESRENGEHQSRKSKSQQSSSSATAFIPGSGFYDYSLPDRGLGTCQPATTRPSPPQAAGKMTSMVTSWPFSPSPIQLPIPSPTSSEKSRTSPLDLSSTPQKSPTGSVHKIDLVASSSKLSPPADQAKKQLNAENKMVIEEKQTPVKTAIAHYDKNVLIFGENAVEIISVGNNKWIVRNEDELCHVATGEVMKKKKSGETSPTVQVKRLSSEGASEGSMLKVPKISVTDSLKETGVRKSPQTVVNGSNVKNANKGDGSGERVDDNKNNCPVLQKMLKPITGSH